jgi:transposase-like protein
MTLCGDLGHKKRDGQPCRKSKGWGIRGATSGPCRYHDGRDQVTRKRLKKRVIDYLEQPELTLREIAAKVGYSPVTIWRWRQQDPEFDEACARAMEAADSVRVRIVEDSLFRRIISDRLNPAETIFFLKNRAPDRWRDKVEREVTGPSGVPRMPIEAIRAMLDDDDDDD